MFTGFTGLKAQQNIVNDIAIFYSHYHLHLTLDYVSPADDEKQLTKTKKAESKRTLSRLKNTGYQWRYSKHSIQDAYL